MQLDRQSPACNCYQCEATCIVLICVQVMAVGSSAAGLLADQLVRHGMPVTAVRKRIQTIAFLGPAAALLVLANRAISPVLAVTCLTIALGTTSLGGQSLAEPHLSACLCSVCACWCFDDVVWAARQGVNLCQQ